MPRFLSPLVRVGTRLFLLAAASAAARSQDLASLPPYQAQQAVGGTIRNFGMDMLGTLALWEKGFQKFQPDVKFADNLPSSDSAISGIEQGTADLAPCGRELVLDDYLGFYETCGHNPLELTVATGTYDVPGASWSPIVFVNRANPISHLTMKQLDGIFGSERSGGYVGFKWMPELGRPASDNIRTWGRLGLTGEWADHEIQTYGYVPGGMAFFFASKVFHGGHKWNPNYKEYAETGTKLMTQVESGILHMLVELGENRYGIGWAGMPQVNKEPEVLKSIKPVALGESEAGPFAEPTREAMQKREYPLTRSVFIYANRVPGMPLEPKLREFLRYVLSREGQEDVVRAGKYLPLTAAVIAEQRAKLD